MVTLQIHGGAPHQVAIHLPVPSSELGLSTETGTEPDTFCMVLAPCWYEPRGKRRNPFEITFWIPALGTIRFQAGITPTLCKVQNTPIAAIIAAAGMMNNGR